MNKQIVINNINELAELASSLASNIRGGEVIELVGDLGAGKTTFTQKFVEALGSDDDVTSPSFTISNLYKTDDLEIHHYDFYRLADAGVVGDELSEVISDPKVLVIIEWAQTVQDTLPEDRLIINIRVLDETRRQLDFGYTDRSSYLLKGVI